MKRLAVFIASALCLTMTGARADDSLTEIVVDNAATAKQQFTVQNARYVIRCGVRLGGTRLTVPAGSTLDFQGGWIEGGWMTGDSTVITGQTDSIFRDVNLDQGSYKVREVSTAMFQRADLDKVDLLREMFRLTSGNMYNHVVIEDKGTPYYMDASHTNCIDVPSNTDVELLGTVKLQPSSKESYSIFHLSRVRNVSIYGGGSIVGERYEHTVNDPENPGEWGMGIDILGSQDIRITNISVADCWGDCVYIGAAYDWPISQNITIDSCRLSGGRRQGVSVVSGRDIVLRDLYIADVSGTDPQAAIDLEPNEGDTVRDVRISNIVARRCTEGIVSWKPEGDNVSLLKNVSITGCDLEVSKRGLFAYSMDTCVVRNTRVITDDTGLRAQNRVLILDSCYFGGYGGGQMRAAIMPFWDCRITMTNSELHCQRLMDNLNVEQYINGLVFRDNKVYGQSEFKTQAANIRNNYFEASALPVVTLTGGTTNTFRRNTLKYVGAEKPSDSDVISQVTQGNRVLQNSIEFEVGIGRTKTVPAATGESGDIYTIDGVRVSPAAGGLPKGIYIIGKRKVVVGK